MAKQISNLTYKIVAFTEIQQIDINDSIDWALEMINLGFESPTLFMLASIKKPANYFEAIEYVKDAIQELGFEMKNGDNATLSYASYYIHLIANGHFVRDNLTKLYQFCQIRDYESLVFEFYLLYWAWDDLDYEENAYSPYWEEATPSNIQQIIVDVAQKWITANKKFYTL